MKIKERRRARSAVQGLAWLSVIVAALGIANRARADETDACISASEKALGLHKAEKLIDERSSLSICAASSCPDAISSSCQQRLAQVKQAIPSIIFFAKDANGQDVAAVKVIVDGIPYADHLEGSPIVMDPGEHQVRFEAEGQAPIVHRFVLHSNEQNRRETVTLGAPAPLQPAIPKALPVETRPLETTAGSTTSSAERGHAQRVAGLVVGGVGVAGLLAGAVAGGLSLSAHGNYEKDCGSNIGAPAGFCNAAGVSGESDAATKGTISTVAFIAGGAAVAAGAALFLFSPRGSSAPQVGVGPGSLWVQGRF